MADAAVHWGRDSYDAWNHLIEVSRDGTPGKGGGQGTSYFDQLTNDGAALESYHSAMASYARHDYEKPGKCYRPRILWFRFWMPVGGQVSCRSPSCEHTHG